MALTANRTVARRGPSRANFFGYPVAPGEKIFAGGLFGVNAAGQAVRVQTTGIVAFVGLADRGYDNTAGAVAAGLVLAGQDIYQLAVPSATPASINAKVYATDDGTLTLTVPGSGFAGVVGYVEGFDAGLTYVKMQGH